jgi:hypothetical protein
MGVIVWLAPPKTPGGKLCWVAALGVVGLTLAVVSLWQIDGNRVEAASEKQTSKRDMDVLLARAEKLQRHVNEPTPVPKSIGKLRGLMEQPKAPPARAYADLEIQFARYRASLVQAPQPLEIRNGQRLEIRLSHVEL